MFRQSKPQPIQSIAKALYISAAALVTIIGVRYLASDLLAPILLALFISALLIPLVRWFRAKGANHTIALFLTVLMLVIGVLLFIWFFWQAIEQLQETVLLYTVNIETLADSLATTFNVDSSDAAIQTLSSNIQGTVSFIKLILGQLGNISVYLLMVPLLVIFIVSSEETIRKQLHRVFASETKQLDRISGIGQSITRYIICRTKINLITGGLVAVFLLIMGVDGWLTWGFLAFMLSYIPYIGLVIASIPPVLIALLSGGFWYAVAVGMGIVVINLFAENVLEPYITGQSLKLSAPAVLVAFFFWSWLLGPIGSLIAVPLTVLAKIVLTDYQETRWIAALMEGNYEEIPTVPSQPTKRSWWHTITHPLKHES